MQNRTLQKTDLQVSRACFGTMTFGSQVDEAAAVRIVDRCLDLGVNFFDTADVYGDGRSERLLAQLKRDRKEEIIIATKAGRRLDPHVAGAYTGENITGFIERSLQNLETDTLDLIQLHCPPTAVYYDPELFGALDDLIVQGKIRNYGVSVEKVEEGIKALEYPNVQSVQIIFNIFRQRPAEIFFDLAKERKVGILARVPLASGMLSGKMTAQTQFSQNDHRQFNRHGESFDRGETFSGVDYPTGLQAVEELRALVPEGMTMAQFALRWILMFDAVTCAIPGAKRPSQVEENAFASDLPPLSDETMNAVRELYESRIRPLVHHYW